MSVLAWISQPRFNCRLIRSGSGVRRPRSLPRILHSSFLFLHFPYCIPFAFPPFGCSYGFCR
jgi:hypothetical protein